MDRLTSMAVFVKAVDLGSFAAVADALDLSGPMVGKHVRFLEDRLGARLLNRTTRRQSLTDLGRAYYERCRLILAEAEAADRLAADQRAEPQGRLRVSIPILLGRRCVAPVLLELARQYPKLELDLSFDDRFADLAGDGYDLAVRSLSASSGNLADRAGLITRRLARHHMVVCASPAYLDLNGRPLQIEHLGAHHGIIYSRSGRVRPWLFPRVDQPPVEVTPINRVRLDDLDSIADAAAAGMGLAWLPRWLVRDQIQAGALVPVLADEPGLAYDNYALWLQTSYLPLNVRSAVDALAAALSKVMN